MAIAVATEKAPSPISTSRENLLGWGAVALLVLYNALTWLPHLGTPLGDSNEGRILARFGLHVRNFWELGPVDSSFATSMQPYVFSSNYAHHPPFANIFEVATSAVLGQGEWQLRFYGYISGLAAVVLLALLLRLVGFGWVPTLLAVGLTVTTNFFWIFARVGGGFATTLGVACAVVYLRRIEQPSRAGMALSLLAAFLAAMTSWPAVATAGLLGLWLFRGRGLDRATVGMGAAMVLAVVVTVGWILNATSLSDLSSQTELRTGGTFTWREFVERQWFRATELTPSWYRVLLFPALGAGIADKRTRWLTLILLAPAALWTFGGRQGAFNHEFWNLLWLPAIGVGAASLADRLSRWLPQRGSMWAAAFAGFVLVAGLWGIASGPAYEKYYGRSGDAGLLLQQTPRPVDQERGWSIENVPGARWMAYYWDVQPRPVTEDVVSEIPPAHLVLIRTDLLPAWFPESAAEDVVASAGRYALVPADSIQEAMTDG